MPNAVGLDKVTAIDATRPVINYPSGANGVAAGTVTGGGSAPATDPFWTSVYLLAHNDGVDASTTFVDSKGLRTLTAVAPGQIDTAQFMFGGASGLFDGVTAGVDVDPIETSVSWGTGDFCIEAWVRRAVTGAVHTIFSSESNGSNIAVRCAIAASGKPFLLTRNAGATIVVTNNGVGPAVLAANTWYHVAATRVSGVCYVFVDGVLQDSQAETSNFTTTLRTSFGYNRRLGVEFMNGWIDDLRVTIGAGRYSSNFTPPTAAFPNS